MQSQSPVPSGPAQGLRPGVWEKPLPTALLTLGVLGIYILLVLFGDALLPAKLTWDSQLLVEMAGQGAEGDGSYYATVRLFNLVPAGLLLPLIGAVGSLMVIGFCGSAYRLSAKVMVVALMVPVLVQDLLRPQKEVIVVMLTLAVALMIMKTRHVWLAVGVFVAGYVAYGAGVRSYFLLMIPAFIFMHLFFEAKHKGLRLVLVLLAVALVLALPESVAYALGFSRDTFNALRIPNTPGNMTMFTNPFEPRSGPAFLGNYLYALVRLHLPVLFHPLSPQAWFLMATEGVYILLLRISLREGNWQTRMMAKIFMAHIAVLIIFEPDLGSYLRHLSSALVYLWPGFVLWQAGAFPRAVSGANLFIPWLSLQRVAKASKLA